jgi:cytochrome c oxidase subunit I
MGLAVAGLGTILGGVNLITTVICMRDPSSAMATKYSSWVRRITAVALTSYLPMAIGVN